MHLVKRKGHTEKFEERKIYASVYAACMTLRMKDSEAELIADNVTKDVVAAIKDLPEVTSRTLHKTVAESLEKYDSDAAYMYDAHRDIS